jgi:hypothetical protein
MNDVKRGADFYDLGKYNNRLNKNTPPPKDRTPEFGKQVFDETDTPKTKIILDKSFPPKNNAPEFGSKTFDLSDAEEHAVDDSMIISEKRLPPTPPQKVTESMIISEKKLPPRPPQKVNETMIISEKKLPPPPPKKGSRPELAPETIATMDDSYEEVVAKDDEDEEYGSYEVSGATDDAEIELGDEDMEEVTMQSKNLNAPPKPTSPPEFKHSIKEKKPTVTTQKTIRISNVYAGLGGNSRLKIKETPSNVSQETLTNTYYKEGNNMSTEKSVQPPEKTPPPSIWQRMKNMFGSRKGK